MADVETTIPDQALNSAKLAGSHFNWSKKIAGFFALLSRRGKDSSLSRIIVPSKTPVEFKANASVEENLNTLLGWLAQNSKQKASSPLRFVENLDLAQMPLKGSPIPNPVKIQQAWWYQGDGGTVTASVLFLYRRNIPISPEDVAIAICGQRHNESLADAYKRNRGNTTLAEIIGQDGLAKLAALIDMYGVRGPLRSSVPRVPIPSMASPPPKPPRPE